MKTKQLSLWVGAALLGFSSLTVQAGILDLYGYSLNIDGNVSDIVDSYNPLDPVPTGVDVSLFDAVTGLGDITISISGFGPHTFDAFFDHEIDEAIYTYFNETGTTFGVASAGQSWEIDEPGWVDGDIFENFTASTLDNGIGTSIYGDTTFPDDVSMAMGWDFTLGLDEMASISLSLTDDIPNSSFYLIHNDPDSNENIYLSSALTISAVPEASILFLFGIGLVGLVVSRHQGLKG